jgi:hypothetical protein
MVEHSLSPFVLNERKLSFKNGETLPSFIKRTKTNLKGKMEEKKKGTNIQSKDNTLKHKCTN